MLRRIAEKWTWLTRAPKERRERLAFAGAAFAAAVTALWTVFTYLFPSEPTRPAAAVVAGCGMATSGTVTAATIDVVCGPSEADIKAVVDKVISTADLGTLIERASGNRHIAGDDLDKITADLKLTRADVIAILKASSRDDARSQPPEQKFAAAARSYIDVSLELARLPPAAVGVAYARDQAAKALQDGNLGRARQLIQAARLIQPLSNAEATRLSARPVLNTDMRLDGNTDLHQAFDAPGLRRPDGVRFIAYHFWPSTPERIPLGPLDHLSDNPVAERALDLKGSRYFYAFHVLSAEQNEGVPTKEQVSANYEAQIRREGGSVVWTCESRSCAGPGATTSQSCSMLKSWYLPGSLYQMLTETANSDPYSSSSNQFSEGLTFCRLVVSSLPPQADGFSEYVSVAMIESKYKELILLIDVLDATN